MLNKNNQYKVWLYRSIYPLVWFLILALPLMQVSAYKPVKGYWHVLVQKVYFLDQSLQVRVVLEHFGELLNSHGTSISNLLFSFLFKEKVKIHQRQGQYGFP